MVTKEANVAVSRVLAEKRSQQSSSLPALDIRKLKENTLLLAQNREPRLGATLQSMEKKISL